MIEEWYSNLPIITKSYITACVLTTLAYHLDIVNLLMLYLNFRLVYERLEGVYIQTFFHSSLLLFFFFVIDLLEHLIDVVVMFSF